MMKSSQSPELTYSSAGVDEPREQKALARMLPFLRATYALRSGLGKPYLESGDFANALDLGGGLGLAITTDGVGTKILLAREPRHYESVAIDCIANNVNDLLCIGAEPIALVDYIALNVPDESLLESIAKGLCEGARLSGICIPGGEIAQVGEMLAPPAGSPVFDLVGTAVGLVALTPERRDVPPLLRRETVEPGDYIVGLSSSGLHSNGYSLARHALFGSGAYRPGAQPPELDGRTVLEELLIPTRIYVPSLIPLMKRERVIKAVANISGGGLLCLARLTAQHSCDVTHLPAMPPIVQLIQRAGNLSDAEVYAAFNVGVGMVVVVAPESLHVLDSHFSSGEVRAIVLGRVIADEQPGRVWLREKHLVGHGDRFEAEAGMA